MHKRPISESYKKLIVLQSEFNDLQRKIKKPPTQQSKVPQEMNKEHAFGTQFLKTGKLVQISQVSTGYTALPSPGCCYKTVWHQVQLQAVKVGAEQQNLYETLVLRNSDLGISGLIAME